MQVSKIQDLEKQNKQTNRKAMKRTSEGIEEIFGDENHDLPSFLISGSDF